jgi:hypothetical protein
MHPRQPERVPLSPLQRQIWFLEKFAPQSRAYHVIATYRLTGVVNLPALQDAVTQVVRRHESLRACFLEGPDDEWQVIQSEVDDTIRCVDLSHVPEAERETAAQELLTEATERPFDLAVGPMLRLLVVRLRSDSHMLAISVHHICVDAWSMTTLVNELSAYYRACVQGRPLRLPEPVQLPDVVTWQLEQTQGARFGQDLAYWAERLRGLEQLALPTDRPRPRFPSYRSAEVSLILPATLRAALQELAGAQDVTMLILIAAAFTAVLARYTGQEEIVVGTVISSRGAPRLRSVVGPLINTLVLRNDLSGDPSFTELLARTRATILGAWAHRNVPFENVVAAVVTRRDASRNPLFQVGLQLLGADHLPCLDLPGLAVEELDIGQGGIAFDLILTVMETAGGLRFRMEFAVDLFDAARVRRLLAHLEQALETVAADPGVRVSELPLSGRLD